MQVDSGKEQVEQKEVQNVYFETERRPGSLMLEARLVLKLMCRLRRGLSYPGIKGGVPLGEDPTQLILQLVK